MVLQEPRRAGQAAGQQASPASAGSKGFHHYHNILRMSAGADPRYRRELCVSAAGPSQVTIGPANYITFYAAPGAGGTRYLPPPASATRVSNAGHQDELLECPAAQENLIRSAEWLARWRQGGLIRTV